MPVSLADKVFRESSVTQKYEHGHFVIDPSDRVKSSLEFLKTKIESSRCGSVLTTAKLPGTTSNLEEELLKKYANISETILRLKHDQLKEIIGEILEDILSSVTISASNSPNSPDSVLSPSTESCSSFSQLTGAGDCSFVTVWSRGSVTPADDLIIKDLLSEEQRKTEGDAKAKILDCNSIVKEEDPMMREIVRQPPGKAIDEFNVIEITGHTKTKEVDERKLITDYTNNPWQDPFNWFIGNFRSELLDELLYVPRTSKQFLPESHCCGDSIMIVQNWITLKEDWILTWELSHQVTTLEMPDNRGPDILLGPEAGVCIIMEEPQGGVAACLLAWHAAARDSCLRLWIVCVGDLSTYMESLMITRHPLLKDFELQMTPLFVPDLATMMSTIVELGKVEWKTKLDIREELSDKEMFIVNSFKSVNNFSARMLVNLSDLSEIMKANEETFHQLSWMSRSRVRLFLEERKRVMQILNM